MRHAQEDGAAEDAFSPFPLLSAIVRLFDLEWSGSLLVHEDDEPVATLRVHAGIVVAARVRSGAGTLLDRASALCAIEAPRIVEFEGTDLVGDGHEVVTGRIDPLALAATAVRGVVSQASVERVIEEIGARLLRLSPGADLGRYGFDRRELQALAALEPSPLDLDELRARCDLPESHLHRLLCVLLATRALTVIAAWKRISSGEIVHAPPVRAPGASRRGDEPTAVVALEALAREQAARAARHPGRRANSTHLEYLPRPMSRARVAQPQGSSERPAVPYMMHQPRSGVEVVRSTMPPPRSERPEAGSPRDAADAHFRWAERLLQSGNYRGAVFEAQRAMKLSSPSPAQRALYAWLLYQRAGEGSPVAASVWAHLEQALAEDPACPIVQQVERELLARRERFGGDQVPGDLETRRRG